MYLPHESPVYLYDRNGTFIVLLILGNYVMCITYVVKIYVVFLVYYKCNSYTYSKCLEHMQFTYFTHVIQVYSLHMYYMS